MSNDWHGRYGDQRPLCIQDMQNLYDQIIEGQKRDDEIMAELGRTYREGTPEYRRAQEAEWQACWEMGIPAPDPLHPAIVHPKTYKRIQDRVKEILDA